LKEGEPVYVGDQTARYIKLYVDSNWGSTSYTRLGKLAAYNKPDWSGSVP